MRAQTPRRGTHLATGTIPVGSKQAMEGHATPQPPRRARFSCGGGGGGAGPRRKLLTFVEVVEGLAPQLAAHGAAAEAASASNTGLYNSTGKICWHRNTRRGEQRGKKALLTQFATHLATTDKKESHWLL